MSKFWSPFVKDHKKSVVSGARPARLTQESNSRREGQMSKFWSPFVKDLVPYVPGEQPKLAKLVKLNTNENPYGPSPTAIAAMEAELNDNLPMYPDQNGERLKQAVADSSGVRLDQVFVGNG